MWPHYHFTVILRLKKLQQNIKRDRLAQDQTVVKKYSKISAHCEPKLTLDYHSTTRIPSLPLWEMGMGLISSNTLGITFSGP